MNKFISFLPLTLRPQKQQRIILFSSADVSQRYFEKGLQLGYYFLIQYQDDQHSPVLIC